MPFGVSVYAAWYQRESSALITSVLEHSLVLPLTPRCSPEITSTGHSTCLKHLFEEAFQRRVVIWDSKLLQKSEICSSFFFSPFLCVSKSVSSFSHFCKGLLSAALWLLLAIPSRVYDFRRSVSENAFRWISINVSALRKVLLYRVPFLARNTSLSLW